MDNPCKFHEDMSRRQATTDAIVAIHATSIDTLFEIKDETNRILGEIQLSMQRLTINMSNMQTSLCDDIKELRKYYSEGMGEIKYSVKKHNDNSIKDIEHYDRIVDEFRANFKELDSFKWFRNWMNDAKDKLPKIIWYSLLSLIGILILYHAAETKFVDFVARITGK